MPTIHDLIYLNRNLRKQLQASISYRSSPLDAQLWPIFYLALKIMKHHEALELLAGREYGSEAGILLRTMFEATVNVLWISKDPEARLKRYAAYQFFDSQKYRDALSQLSTLAGLPESEKKRFEEQFKQLAQQSARTQEEYGFKRNQNWSGKTLKAMAKDVGWQERYEFLYRLYSDITHSNFIASNNYVFIDSSGRMRLNNEPQAEHCKTCLIEAYVYLWAAFSVIGAFLELGLEPVLEKAYRHMPIDAASGSPHSPGQ